MTMIKRKGQFWLDLARDLKDPAFRQQFEAELRQLSPLTPDEAFNG